MTVDRRFLSILVMAFALRLLPLIAVVRDPSLAMTPDSGLYLRLGQEAVSVYVHSDPLRIEESIWRTPGYPLFCGLADSLFGEPITSVIGLQVVLSTMTLIPVYGLSVRAFGRPAALAGTAVLALDPLSILYAGLLRSETLFATWLALVALSWDRLLRRGSADGAAGTGLWVGLAALVRPVALYLPAVLVPATLWLCAASFRSRSKIAVLLVIGFCIPIGGWMARNHALSGAWIVSSIEGTNLLYYRAAGAIAEDEGTTREVVARRLADEVGRPAQGTPLETRLALERSEGLRLLAEHPRGAIMGWLKGAVRLAFGPGYDVAHRFGQRVPGMRSLVPALVVLELAITYCAAAWGLAALWRRRDIRSALGLVALIAYFVLISSGPEAYSRFRVPLMPLLAPLAGVGLSEASNVFRCARRRCGERPAPERILGIDPPRQAGVENA